MPRSRHQVFSIHLWRDSLQRSETLARQKHDHGDVADFSVTQDRPFFGPESAIASGIEDQVRRANIVLLHNAPGIHKSPWCVFEMELVRRFSKRLVVVQPPRSLALPLPAAIEGYPHSVVTDRRDGVRSAIEGLYTESGYVHRTWEQHDRARVVRIAACLSGVTSLLMVVKYQSDFDLLREDAWAAGIDLRWSQEAGAEVLRGGLQGALFGALIGGILGGDLETAFAGAIGGGAVGAALATRKIVAATWQALPGGGHVLRLTSSPL